MTSCVLILQGWIRQESSCQFGKFSRVLRWCCKNSIIQKFQVAKLHSPSELLPIADDLIQESFNNKNYLDLVVYTWFLLKAMRVTAVSCIHWRPILILVHFMCKHYKYSQFLSRKKAVQNRRDCTSLPCYLQYLTNLLSFTFPLIKIFALYTITERDFQNSVSLVFRSFASLLVEVYSWSFYNHLLLCQHCSWVWIVFFIFFLSFPFTFWYIYAEL